MRWADVGRDGPDRRRLAEKLANPELALALLDEMPYLNVAQAIGLPIGDLEFIRLAGRSRCCSACC